MLERHPCDAKLLKHIYSAREMQPLNHYRAFRRPGLRDEILVYLLKTPEVRGMVQFGVLV